MTSLDERQLTGRDDSHIEWRDGIGLQPDCWSAFEALRRRAVDAGFELAIASGFRSFERQCDIWNRKAAGERPVHDDAGRPLDLDAMSEEDKLAAILRFSALPGTSRHHWGTDLDVFDAAALPEGYRVQLVPAEVTDAGMFGPLHVWLDAQIAAGTAEGFFRPYQRDQGGVAPERWHLSFAPGARDCEQRLTEALVEEAVSRAGIALGAAVIRSLPTLLERYLKTTPAPA